MDNRVHIRAGAVDLRMDEAFQIYGRAPRALRCAVEIEREDVVVAHERGRHAASEQEMLRGLVVRAAR